MKFKSKEELKLKYKFILNFLFQCELKMDKLKGFKLNDYNFTRMCSIVYMYITYLPAYQKMDYKFI